MKPKKKPKKPSSRPVVESGRSKKVPNPGYDIEVSEYDADTVPVFCKKNRISMAFYYKLKLQGKTPREMHLGRKRLISHEAARQWRIARETEADAKIADEIGAAMAVT